MYIINVPQEKSIIVVLQKYIAPNTISFSPFTVRGGKLMESPLKLHDKSAKTIFTTSAVGRPAGGMPAFEHPVRGATVLA
jgi:hypothetical protein